MVLLRFFVLSVSDLPFVTACCFLLSFLPLETIWMESPSDASSSFRFVPSSLCSGLCAIRLVLTVLSAGSAVV